LPFFATSLTLPLFFSSFLVIELKATAWEFLGKYLLEREKLVKENAWKLDE
jgi:hypothetical protein